MLILVKLQAKTCNFTKINTPPWAFFTFFKLWKWYQIAQHITYYYDDHDFMMVFRHQDIVEKTTGLCGWIKLNKSWECSSPDLHRSVRAINSSKVLTTQRHSSWVYFWLSDCWWCLTFPSTLMKLIKIELINRIGFWHKVDIQMLYR